MDTLFLYNTKTLKEKFKTKVFAGDNNITKINVQIPDNIGGYPKRECEYNLRAIIPEGNLSYMINPSQPYFYITNDITEKAQTVKLMMIITHEGNVIGRTNTVDLVVNEPAEAPDPPLTPREEFDEVIAEQRAEIAEQAETISTQGETITQQTEQITELSGEVTELQGEVSEQATTISRQNTTIDELNRRVPPLQTLDPINPTTEQVTYRPSGDNVGFNPFTVNGATCEGLGVNPEYYKAGEQCIDKVGSYAPPYGTSVGGMYIMSEANGLPENIVFRNINNASIMAFLSDNQKALVKSIDFINCSMTSIATAVFKDFTSLGNLTLPNTIETINGAIKNGAFQNTGDNQSTLVIPESVTQINPIYCFYNTRFKEIVLPQKATALSGDPQAFISGSIIEKINIPHGFTYLRVQMFQSVTNLKTLFIPNTITSANAGWIDGTGAGQKLEFVTLENEFNCSLKLSYSTLYSHETILSWFNALADRTGETAYTLTIGTTNLNKMTAEEKAIATNKNWNLA